MLDGSALDSLADAVYRVLAWAETDYEEVRDAQTAFRRVFRRWFPLFILAGAGISLAILLDVSGHISYPRQVYGLAFDLVGAVALALALLQTPAGYFRDNSAGYGGGPVEGYMPAARQTFDAAMGGSS
jgi:hypothetical protein